MRRPPSRTLAARSAPNDPRRIVQVFPNHTERLDLLSKASYIPYSKHKKNPQAYGLKPYEGIHEDPTYCDEHAGFGPQDMSRTQVLLERGIRAGLLGKSRKKGDPGLLWTVDDNGWIYEAQISNPGYGQYHGYPVLPNEAIAKKVLVRYAVFVDSMTDSVLTRSLRLARERYR